MGTPMLSENEVAFPAGSTSECTLTQQVMNGRRCPDDDLLAGLLPLLMLHPRKTELLPLNKRYSWSPLTDAQIASETVTGIC
jgi:hypothetical protein